MALSLRRSNRQRRCREPTPGPRAPLHGPVLNQPLTPNARRRERARLDQGSTVRRVLAGVQVDRRIAAARENRYAPLCGRAPQHRQSLPPSLPEQWAARTFLGLAAKWLILTIGTRTFSDGLCASAAWCL